MAPFPYLLTLNGGSSSIRFALYRVGDDLERQLSGKIDRIGLPGTVLEFDERPGFPPESLSLEGSDQRTAANFLIDALEKREGFASLRAVGHRVVHGMRHSEPEVITEGLLDDLERIGPLDPEHLPGEIELIRIFRERHPDLIQVACFDTAFHRTLPPVARMLAIPRRYQREGVERYGFHGLSYAYLIEELARLGDPAATAGRVVLAHLGNGASLAAVQNGKSIDTSMGFTPTGGLPMGTRSGDLDPGLAGYLARTEGMTAESFHRMVNQESGLLGVSEISSDMRELLDQEATDERAAEAVALFCYQASKWIGSFAAALGGLDTLVFSGGIGENAPSVRARICERLGFLGLGLDETKNAEAGGLISADDSWVKVRVIRTDEELMIARSVERIAFGSETR
ncbi:MAG TPA: acetate/propionate family kinase [Thermoanaerobaculia bacterium]|jgi:acetate kinase|nr:acetate/propionate family kinase [Thermoanaerobaculia bacterium]